MKPSTYSWYCLVLTKHVQSFTVPHQSLTQPGNVPDPRLMAHRSSDDACTARYPGSESEGAITAPDNGAFYYCVTPHGSLGPYLMRCPSELAMSFISAPTLTDAGNKKAECQERTRRAPQACSSRSIDVSCNTDRHTRSAFPPSSISNDLQSTIVHAGHSGCINSRMAGSGMEAYVTSVDDAKLVQASYISWYELEPRAKFMGQQTNTDHLSIASSASDALYRACAFAAIGAGNLKLHIRSGTRF